VVGNLTLVRCTAEAVYRLRDDELVTHTAAGKQTERLAGAPAIRRAAAEVFGLPRLPVEAALVALDEIRRREALPERGPAAPVRPAVGAAPRRR
jgi:hypothetical protein